MTEKLKERARIIAKIQRWADEQRQFLSDLEHWNQTHPDEEPIDMPDIRQMLATADDMLAKDPGHGPIAPFQYLITRGTRVVQ